MAERNQYGEAAGDKAVTITPSRPDLVVRGFKLKLKLIEDNIVPNGIFGRRVAHLRVMCFRRKDYLTLTF